VPDSINPLLEEVASNLLHRFRLHGHVVQAKPDDHTDIVLTTARFGEPIRWREALVFWVRRRFNLTHSPTLYTLIHVTPARFQQLLGRLQTALAKESPDPADFIFPGLAPRSPHVLIEQGKRGGAILALERVVQAQAMCLHILLVVGDDRPLFVYHFDLVGAHPRTDADDLEAFYDDIVLRMVTSESTYEVTEHEVVGDPVPAAVWGSLNTPAAMCAAGRQLGERDFFTAMVRIADVVQVPAVTDAVASQYSEGCFATWDPVLGALVATVTGSARPVDKGDITEDDLAVIVGVRSDGMGALVRHVAGKRNDPPSSEAVELRGMDGVLPTITLGPEWTTTPTQVPVVRSKLHGHRGIAAYDPRRVEFVPLDPPYYHYLVSCATGAQAEGIKKAFGRSQTLQNPEDPRQLAFTVLPGHGVVIAEKWVPGAAPFQTMWEYMDAGYLQVDNLIPQGPMEYAAGPDGRMALRTSDIQALSE